MNKQDANAITQKALDAVKHASIAIHRMCISHCKDAQAFKAQKDAATTIALEKFFEECMKEKIARAYGMLDTLYFLGILDTSELDAMYKYYAETNWEEQE